MDAQERKERITDLINQVEDLVSEIKNGESEVKTATDKAYELDNLLSNMSEVDGWDIEELSKNIFVGFINGTNLESVQEEVEGFKNELEDFMSELSETKREKLEDKYSNLETVYDMFNLDNYESIEEVLEVMSEVIVHLKDMK